MSDDHPTGYVDLTKPNADAASSTPEPSAPEPPASTQAAPAPTEEADVLAGSPPAAPTPTPAQMQAKAQAQAAQQTRAQAQTAQAAGIRPSFMNEMPDLRETTDDDPATVKSHEEFTTVYDIIDQLEAALGEAKSSIFAPGMVKVRPRRIHRPAFRVEENAAGAGGARLRPHARGRTPSGIRHRPSPTPSSPPHKAAQPA